MVGGLHPTLKKEWYLELLQRLRALDPKLHIKALPRSKSAIWRSEFSGCRIRDTLETLRAAGLGSITGGGAEIFDPVVRDKICRGKETAAEWLDVHRTGTQWAAAAPAPCSTGISKRFRSGWIICGQLGELQDETGGFTGFVPFAFEPSQSHGILAQIKRASAFEQLRNLAVSRIYLDNIDHLTAYWVSLGLPLAQVSLSYGVDDLHGTILEEKIFHMAGATTPQQQTVAALEHAIREAGREPVQRDSHYRHLNGRRRAGQA
jgi:aminodeoxyfutalosine synthase